METYSQKEQLSKAIESNSLEELHILHLSRYMNVRRAVARNSNINTEIANKLLMDPVMNVSYMASLHPKCTNERVFPEEHLTSCVMCERDERELICDNCNQKEYSSNIIY
ncbi:hypothetical protein CRV08_06455 [Halarcobacter ebronensis]|uniref:Uncharacterized protein n=1 Tax=Halarcobacter ebronensis TaxID=1462615 RepID=A0A4V1LRK0_9BACT|nr:hypothetical protein [Halarcobacter ebronensis]RXJ68468.1 hypothetical protein CRV08_06455 [Halarcobacter ebronensis]